MNNRSFVFNTPLFTILSTSACSPPDDPGGTQSIDGSTDTNPAPDTTSGPESDSDPSDDSTPDPECATVSDCSPGTLCEDGACVPCTAAVTASCPADHPTTPVCDPATGKCAGCTPADTSACPSDHPICLANECSPCTEHSHCPDSACNLLTGACLPTDRVYWIDSSVAESGDGSEAAPLATVEEAIGLIPAGGEGTVYLAGSFDQLESVTIAAHRTVALLGKTPGAGIYSTSWATLDIYESAVFVADVELRHSDYRAIECNYCTLIAQDVRVRSIDHEGVYQFGGKIRFERARLVGSGRSDVYIAKGQLAIVDSFVGGSVTGYPAMLVESGSFVDILYSTIGGGTVDSPAIECTGVYAVDLRNSIAVSRHAADEIDCPDITISNSALEQAIGGNLGLGSVNPAWFVDYELGDFHLGPLAPAALASAGAWAAGDPIVDIDGDPRPASESSPDYAGADIPE